MEGEEVGLVRTEGQDGQGWVGGAAGPGYHPGESHAVAVSREPARGLLVKPGLSFSVFLETRQLVPRRTAGAL